MENYIGEIRIFGGTYAPEGWQFCNGALVQISENETLYSLIGTAYGGDGQNTFALPDLRSRVVVSQGTSTSGSPYAMGQVGGQENVTLTSAQMPIHQHPIANLSAVTAQTGGTPQASAQNAYFGNAGGTIYKNEGSGVNLNASAVSGSSSVVGSSTAHSNIQPVVACNYIIAMQGIYPSFD
ncbi:phage tail protein [Hymenobacter monticola]|uniref:Tail fiber protein n=1 Tax=Hymenobacter monticola TaxID=1705399 RepID=A0ABY4AYZ8_9BACT|nr:tail fiber protein [Hymenobacter monticola]UOE32138.1 tail fiber protein [Hymenobacter monticola]